MMFLRKWFTNKWVRVASAMSVCALFMALAMLWYPMEVDYYTEMKASSEMQDRHGQLVHAFLNEEDAWCIPRTYDQISPYLIEAVIATEDQRFGNHPGVDPIAVIRAAWQNLRHGRIVSGASTLAMQVVKMAYRHHGQTCNKFMQAIQAVRLQTRLDKEKIIQAYLNHAPYGGNLIGCEAASRRYFGKPCRELTLTEAATLAGLPQAPAIYSPLRHPENAMTRRNYVLQRMLEEKYINKQQYQEAVEKPLRAGFHSFPQHAPHLAMRTKAKNSIPVYTTLDLEIQSRLERQLQTTVEQYETIENAAAMVVDVENAEILAYAGSADFFSQTLEGQYDVCRSPRSPGSTLKPFAYGLAMQENRLYANETLYDGPWDRGKYQPENFDLRYTGLVSAEEALQHSLNIPAIIVLQRIGLDPFCRFLQDTGLTTFSCNPQDYGLGMILGNCEVKLKDMAEAYTALAAEGKHRPITWKKQMVKEKPEKQILSKGIAVQLYRMLEQPFPHELSDIPITSVHTKSRVAWKTGTSQGYRDAWTYAFNRHYVVAVWMGNNDSRASSHLVGAQSALPLAAKIFRSLPSKVKSGWPKAADLFHRVEVCTLSGLPAHPSCPRRKTVLLPREQYVHRNCDMHYFKRGDQAKQQIQERWPASAQEWNLASIDTPYKTFVQNQSSREKTFRIVQPAPDAEYLLTGEERGDRIRLKSSWDEKEEIHWYLDNQYIGTSSSSKDLYIELTPGQHQVSAMTKDGSVHAVHYTVHLPRYSSASE